MNLQQLIQKHRGKRTYATLADASYGELTAPSLQRLATTTGATFPSANTLQGLADVFNLPINAIILAAAKSAGLNPEPVPDTHDLQEQLYYHQHHAATYKNQLKTMRAHISNATPSHRAQQP